MTDNTRSIWQNIKIIVNGMADAASKVTEAVSTTAAAVNELAEAGNVLAASNTKIIRIETRGEEEAKLRELKEKYADINLD